MIRNAISNDLYKIAKLHTESFENHFLPKLGLGLLAKYYKEFIDDENIFIVNINANKEIDGLLLGTPDSSIGRNKFIKNNKIGLSLRVLLLSIKFDKDTWVRIKGFIQSFFSKKKNDRVQVNSDKPSFKVITLLSICVSENSKGKGISRALVKEFEERLTNLGYEGYILTVHQENDRANKFYEKTGMRIFTESDNEYKYIKQLLGERK